MSLQRPSRFQIHSLDDPGVPDAHFRAFWRTDGRTFRVHVWGSDQCEWMSEPNRPHDAIQLEGPGWMTIRLMKKSRDEEDHRSSTHLGSWSVSSQ